MECILLHNTFPSATVFSSYSFTVLMFRKLNKPQSRKIKQQNFISIRAFNSRLNLDISRSFKWKESFIFRYFKVFQVKRIVYIYIFQGLSSEKNRLYLYISRSFKWKELLIFRYFKVFQVFQMFTCGPSDFLLLAGRFVSCFCIGRIHFKSSHTRQFWT